MARVEIGDTVTLKGEVIDIVTGDCDRQLLRISIDGRNLLFSPSTVVAVLDRPLKVGDEVRPTNHFSVGDRRLVIRYIEVGQVVCWNELSKSLEFWRKEQLERRPAIEKVYGQIGTPANPIGWVCATPGQKP